MKSILRSKKHSIHFDTWVFLSLSYWWWECLIAFRSTSLLRKSNDINDHLDSTVVYIEKEKKTKPIQNAQPNLKNKSISSYYFHDILLFKSPAITLSQSIEKTKEKFCTIIFKSHKIRSNQSNDFSRFSLSFSPVSFLMSQKKKKRFTKPRKFS